MTEVSSSPRSPSLPSDGGAAARAWLPPRAGYLLAALLVCVAAGIAVVHVPTLFVVGAIVCLFAVWIVLTRPFIGLILYTCAFMLRPGQVFPMLDALHLERVVGVLALTGMYVQQYHSSHAVVIDGQRQTRLFFLFGIAVLISVPFSYWRLAAVNGFIDVLKLIAWYLLLVHLLDTRRRLRIYMAVFLVLIAYVGVDAFNAYLHGQFHYRMGIERAIGQTDAGGDPNHLAATMAATIPILLLLTFRKEMKLWRLFPAAGMVLMTITLSITGSRSGLLGFLAGLLVLWWRSRHRVIAAVLGLTILAAGALLLPQQYKGRYATIGQSQLDDSSKTRLQLWKNGVRMAIDHPLTGVGIGCFATANSMDYSPASDPTFLVSHSLYVQVPAELGLVGLVVVLLFMLEIFRLNRATARRVRAAGPEWWFEALLLQACSAGLIALLVTGIFGDNLMRHTWYVYAAFGAVIARLYADRAAGPAPEGAPA
jgi:putative inorganic carbon (hco3(-)) transporter